MTIHYQLKPEDMYAIVDWRFGDTANQKQIHKMVRGIFFSMGVIGLIFTLALALRITNWSITLVVILAVICIASLLGIMFAQQLQGMPGRMREEVVLAHKEPEYAYMFGNMTLEISEEGILRVSPLITTLWKWEAISKIVANDRYTILALGFADYIVIPKDGVQAGDYSAFAAEANRLYELATGN